jgi:hypothetical protein
MILYRRGKAKWRSNARKQLLKHENRMLAGESTGCEWVGTPTELLKKVKPHGIEKFTTPTSIGTLLTNRSKLPVDQVTFQVNNNGKRTHLINLMFSTTMTGRKRGAAPSRTAN